MIILTMRWAGYNQKGVIVTTNDGRQIGTPFGDDSAFWKEQDEFLALGGVIGEVLPPPDSPSQLPHLP